VHDQHGDASADEDKRRLGPEYCAKAQSGQRCDEDAGQIDRIYCPGRLESLRRVVTARPGQVPDGQADQQAAQGEHGQRPPQRCRMKAQILREGDEEVLLALSDGLQEEVGDDRHRNPDDGAEYQERQVSPALHHLQRAGRSR
jgi:hypothetical protein